MSGKYWTRSANPAPGCAKKLISEGCRHCWAVGMVKRMGAAQVLPRGLTTSQGWGWTGVHAPKPGLLAGRLLAHARKSHIIAVGWLGDLFYTPRPWHCELFATALEETEVRADAGLPPHKLLWLTKRPAIMAEAWFRCALESEYTAFWYAGVSICTRADMERVVGVLHGAAPFGGGWWLSLEPLLEPVELPDAIASGVTWVVLGAETGPNRRPMPLEAARAIVEWTCRHGIPLWVKDAGDGTGKIDGVEYRETPWEEPCHT